MHSRASAILHTVKGLLKQRKCYVVQASADTGALWTGTLVQWLRRTHYSVMPLFLTSMGASKTSISMIEGIAESTATLLKAISGIWSDKIRKNKPFMIFGYGMTALVTPLYALVGAPVHVLWLRLEMASRIPHYFATRNPHLVKGYSSFFAEMRYDSPDRENILA